MLSQFPYRDRLIEADGMVSRPYARWFTAVWTLLKQGFVGLSTTTGEPAADAHEVRLYVDGTALKVKYPDGTIRTVTTV